MKHGKGMAQAVVLVMVVLALALPALATAQTTRAVVTVNAQWVKQGGLTTVYVAGDQITNVTGMFQERGVYFYPSKLGYKALLSASIDLKADTYPLQLLIEYADGTSERIDQPVTVASGGYATVSLYVVGALLPLTDPTVEDAEIAKVFNIMDRFTPARYWDGGFILPNPNDLVAWFGTYRSYNGQSYLSRHTGIDIAVGEGVPVPVSASGRVVLSQPLPIRGGYVLVDHGWGIYTGYAHLSERFVVPGDWVNQGDVIGMSGMTGRVTGAHIHFEIAVDGAWIDPEDFLALGLDTATE
ncbi:MAG TPA: M23 family metallopeptidase [Aggregatilinea sp.]|jgi:murein DD-endopeptidase MepM/ murein hydrolase activator NlpD|uniref:M23 family metallopeptidase n=1 Tax=Aggregatilinea sp. TaxID=2806333 RepID=UPI002B5B34AC|nr:M23 family metallopeptidase [Aggregatilinea sp.]HML22871.1 M23 family metallopeptidase [Aggregatilinea sp.]